MKLSKKTVLALAAGVALDQLGLAQPEANLEGVVLEGDALAAATTEATEIQAAITAAATKAAAEATTVLTAEVTDLKTKLEAAQSAIATAEGKATLATEAATSLTAKLTASSELSAKQAEVVKTSMSVMSVALGGSADVGATLVGTELVAEHDKMAEQFKKKFPTGRVAAVMGDPKKDEKPAPVNPMFASLVRPVTN